MPQHTLITEGPERGISIGDWQITVRKAPICNAPELDEAAKRLSVPTPEMLFGNNHLTLRHKTGAGITFKAIAALQRVDASSTAADGIKVAYSDHWTKKSAAAHTTIKDIIKPYDWTYTTDYIGTTLPSEDTEGADPLPNFEASNEEQIDLAHLKVQEPILFYEELDLFEDELGDNGTAIMNARVRVMPSCLLVLLRFFLRVDDVLFRVYDTRLYHRFGQSSLIREVIMRECPYLLVREKIPKPPQWEIHKKGSEDLSLLTNSNWVADVIAKASGAPDAATPPSKEVIANESPSVPVKTRFVRERLCVVA
ncbi:hypothetical protein HK097_010083 [Rhizophlyctis rosea]|uniref:TIP41-like protein n=1 Tax=Rhizophlyctis rosea TaxID=64517 RepID=A0AAD5SHJ7_9FUNG|nr:hypothetical protein HK097_010083 [Rhizophlyctis rosea]